MSAVAPRRCPYVGLVPYSEDDWEYFFGREQETELIIANLTAARLTLLYGASGVGKSSVLRAGVAHRLDVARRSNVAAERPPEFALTVFSAWRDAPLTGLARAMHASVARVLGAASDVAPEPAALVDACPRWAQQVGGDLFVVLDQFEEYFLYHGRDEGEASFGAQFARLVNTEGVRANFLIAIREDAMSRLDVFKGAIPRLFDNYLRLDHLASAAAERAIREPLARFNAAFPAEAVTIEDALVAEVLRQTRTEPPGGHALPDTHAEEHEARIEAPYLQVVMTRIWDEEFAQGSRSDSPPRAAAPLPPGGERFRAAVQRSLRLDTFTTKLGGADQIVRTHLDREMEKLTPAEQDLAAKAFRYLVTSTGTKIALAVEDFEGYADVSPEVLAPVLEKLSSGERRILRRVPVPDRPGEVRYEIFHDVLGPAITAWWREREGLRQLAAYQAEIDERQRQHLADLETQRLRTQSKWLKIAIASVILFMALAVVSVRARFAAQDAEQEALIAQQQTRLAEAQAKEAAAQAKDAERQAEQARFAYRQLEDVAEQRAKASARMLRESTVGKGQIITDVRIAGVSPSPGAKAAASELRRAFLTGDSTTAEATAKRLDLLNTTLRFGADCVPVAQSDAFRFSLWPIASSVAAGLGIYAAITFKLDSTAPRQTLLAGDPAWGFRATYIGDTAYERVPVLLEYADAARSPQLAVFDMAAKLAAGNSPCP